MDNVFSLKAIMLSPQIQAVASGIGITKSAYNAQTDGLSILTKSALL